MPEEINRLLSDQLCDLLFTPSADADENLLREGIPQSKIHFVGNVMIDSLVRLLPKARAHFDASLSGPYALVTLHRPSNVDDLLWLRDLLAALSDLSKHLKIVFPVHPRTRQRIHELGAAISTEERIRLCEPSPYLEFIGLQKRAALVITDSGGIQEETTFLGIPCLTVRENTERPITISLGTNQLVGRDIGRLRTAAEGILKNRNPENPSTKSIPYWDGHAAERIARVIVRGSTS
jgi:UDP-N-acetylglucosamine 2-epimerase (non-hydrolysing)